MSRQQWYEATEGAGGQEIAVRGELFNREILNWTAIVKKAASGGATWETWAGQAGYCDTEDEARKEVTAVLGIKEDLESKES